VLPVLIQLESALIAGLAATKTFAQGGFKGMFDAPIVFLKEYSATMAKSKQLEDAGKVAAPPLPLTGDDAPDKIVKIKEAATEYSGLTSILDS